MTKELITTVWDTETNGKRPKQRKGTIIPPEKEPAIVQIAAMLFEGRRPVGHLSCFVHPLRADGSTPPIPDPDLAPNGLTDKDFEFFEKSGITEDRVAKVGLSNKAGMAMFNHFLKVSDRMVAHNAQFDSPLTRAAFQRVNCPLDTFDSTPKFCTMKTLEMVLKLPGRYGYKFPTLDESYRALVDPKGFEGAHDAMVDVDACAKVLWAVEDGIANGDERFANQTLWQM